MNLKKETSFDYTQEHTGAGGVAQKVECLSSKHEFKTHYQNKNTT
jgi:hypothetical protein